MSTTPTTTIIAYGFIFNAKEKELAERIYKLGTPDEENDSNITFTVEEYSTNAILYDRSSEDEPQTLNTTSFDLQLSSIMDLDENETYYGEFLFLKQDTLTKLTKLTNLVDVGVGNPLAVNMPTLVEMENCKRFAKWVEDKLQIILPMPEIYVFKYHTRGR